jgi:putative transposase
MHQFLVEQGYKVNPKRVRRLLRTMGLDAIYAKRRLSKPEPGHRTFPYLLRNLPIVRPNQVWGTDITIMLPKNWTGE